MAATPATRARGRYIATVKHHGADHPAAVAARDELAAVKAEQYIAKVLAATPALTAEQRLHLTRLLTA